MPPDWLITVSVFVVAVAAALAVHGIAYRRGLRLLPEGAAFWRSALTGSRAAMRVALVILALSLAARIAPLTARETAILQHVLLLGFVALAALAARTLLDIWMGVHLRRFRLDVDDNLLARKHVTQMRILRRIADTAIVVVACGAVLMSFEGVRQYGISLLASAGAAGIVAGLALQPLLKNLFAGIQLALTQPIRIDDAVIVEGEWGNVEEITSTYVVVRIWDRRRLVVPLAYFIEQPFQNWTREEATLIGTVLIYLDHAAPLGAIRGEAERIVAASGN